ncbi:hypothetical protein EV426DRAFT_388210 [Tirmania nivea]|nr:hypothetical protein EV426DRAFT_388210 [Tirmania nivea]
MFDMWRDIERYYIQSEERFPFGGLDGASESKVAPSRPARRYYRAGRPAQMNKISMRLSAIQAGAQEQKSPEKEFAKNWLQTQMQRARSLPDHLKSNEDRLLEWLNTDIDDKAAPLSAEVASFTMQMFGLLKPGGAFSGVFAPGGAMAAHPGTYLAAHSAVLGVLPAIGMSKCNCVHCNQELGRLGSGVWWRCKGCPLGKGFICGDCFLSGRKCGSGHIFGSQYSHSGEAGHVLVRRGYTASVEEFNIHFHDEWQGRPDMASDNEIYSPPRVTRRLRSEPYTAASLRSGPNSMSIQTNASKTQEFLFPLAPQGGSVEHTPSRKYSPPPHVSKARTGSVSSLLPAIPTPSPSPPPRETLRQKPGTAATVAAEGVRDSTAPLLAIRVPGSILNEGREPRSDLMTFGVNKLRTGAANESVSTLGILRGDEQENFTSGITSGPQSIADSDVSSENSGSMTTGAGDYKIISWRIGNTGSPGPSELMHSNWDQQVGLRAAAAFEEGLELEPRPKSHVDLKPQPAMPGTPGWEGERERIVLEKEQGKAEWERNMAGIVVRLPPAPPPMQQQQ